MIRNDLIDPFTYSVRRLIMRKETTFDTARALDQLQAKNCGNFSSNRAMTKLEEQPRQLDEWTQCLINVRDSQDQAAFVRLFNQFAPRVKAYLIKSGGSNALAEDATQEAMATVWQKAHLFNPARAGASTWIFTIARNKQIDGIRKQRRPEPEDVEWNTGDQEEASAALEISQEETAIRCAVSTLPDAQRKLIERAFFNDMSHSEIAAETGIPLGTIKSRIRLGLNKIRYGMTGLQ